MMTEQSEDPKHTSEIISLKYTCTQVIKHINNRDWTHPDWNLYLADYITVNTPAAFSGPGEEPAKVTRAEYLKTFEKFCDANSEYHCEAVNIIPEVDHHGQVATVWLTMIITGHPPNVRRQATSISHCRRKNGHWVVYRQAGFRGPVEF